MDLQEILEFLPHRIPFLMVDRVISCEPYKGIVAVKNVTINEPYFAGHFPHHPVMPGVLIIEALAQTAAILSFKTMDKRPGDASVSYFVGINRARFKRPVFPGDQLMLHVRLLRHARGLWKFQAEARVSDLLAAEAELLCTEKLL
jgi:3-hydroxyacyl-[acyl-carrier-protein] dehydratase